MSVRSDLPVGDPARYSLPHNFREQEFDDFINSIAADGASDITIQSGDFVFAEIERMLYRVTPRALSENELITILTTKYGPSSTGQLESGAKLDWDLKARRSGDDVAVYRANAVRCRVAGSRSYSMTLRPIPGLPPRYDALGIEPDLRDIMFPRYGLILVVGTTGSGKSTYLASTIGERLLDYKNPVKISTIEDPVEYGYAGMGRGYMPEVSQIQLGDDLKKFADASSSAMRRKLHVIVMGEIRDEETAHLGVELAQTGHCVMATMHVDEPQQAIERLVSFFPVAAQASIASSLKANLKVIVAQKITRSVRGKGIAYRSWLDFDADLKDQLSALPHHQWEAHCKAVLKERGLDMCHRASEGFAKGDIALDRFAEVTGLSPKAARAYLQEKGLIGE